MRSNELMHVSILVMCIYVNLKSSLIMNIRFYILYEKIKFNRKRLKFLINSNKIDSVEC